MAQQIFSCEIVTRELENGFSSENDLEHSLQVNHFSPESVLGVFLSLQGRGMRVFENGFSPVNGFPPKMASPGK